MADKVATRKISNFAAGLVVDPVDISRGVEKVPVSVRDPEDAEMVTDFVVSSADFKMHKVPAYVF